jgi:hypothetical protein
MVVMVRIGVPYRFQPAQTSDAGKLGIDQHHKVVPAVELLVIGIAVVAIHNTVEPPAHNRFEQMAKNAIAVPHARPRFFLSLDNQKVAAS